MSYDKEDDPRRRVIIKILRRNKICLWEEPFWQNDKSTMNDEFISTIVSECHYPYEVVYGILHDLQQHSLERFREKVQTETKDVITLKVKVNGKETNFTLKAQSSLAELFQLVADAENVPSDRVNLIFKGHLLQRVTDSLSEWQIRNHSKLLALVVEADIPGFLKKESEASAAHRRVNDLKSAIDIESNKGRCCITNTFGYQVNIPFSVESDLTTALILHNQARKSSGKNRFDEALTYLLEAERHFDSVKSQYSSILENSSNVAQYNLDIVWCFVKLKALDSLDDAGNRLKCARENLNHTFGSNLEKVTRVKGIAVNELVLLMKLTLLEGIVAFHKGLFQETRSCFQKTETLMEKLRVDDGNFTTLVSMGYTDQESRLALRSCGNDVSRAITYLIDRRDDLGERRKEWQRENREKCLRGVDQISFTRLIEDIGVSGSIAREALLKHRNNYQKACAYAMSRVCSRGPQGNGRSEHDFASPDNDDEKKKQECRKKVLSIVHDSREAEKLTELFEGQYEAIVEFLITGTIPKKFNQPSEICKLMNFEPDECLDSTLVEEEEYLNDYKVRLTLMESSVNPIP